MIGVAPAPHVAIAAKGYTFKDQEKKIADLFREKSQFPREVYRYNNVALKLVEDVQLAQTMATGQNPSK